MQKNSLLNIAITGLIILAIFFGLNIIKTKNVYALTCSSVNLTIQGSNGCDLWDGSKYTNQLCNTGPNGGQCCFSCLFGQTNQCTVYYEPGVPTVVSPCPVCYGGSWSGDCNEESCYTITLTTSPNPVTVGNQITINASYAPPNGYVDTFKNNATGTQGWASLSTSGFDPATCTNATSSGATCTAGADGSYTWTRSWGSSCSNSTTYTISDSTTGDISFNPSPCNIAVGQTACNDTVTYTYTGSPQAPLLCSGTTPTSGGGASGTTYSATGLAAGSYPFSLRRDAWANNAWSCAAGTQLASETLVVNPAKDCTVSLSASSADYGTPVTVNFTGLGNQGLLEDARLWVERSDGQAITPAPPNSITSDNYYRLETCSTHKDVPCSGFVDITLPPGLYYFHCDLPANPSKCTGNPFCNGNEIGGTSCAGWTQCNLSSDATPLTVTLPPCPGKIAKCDSIPSNLDWTCDGNWEYLGNPGYDAWCAANSARGKCYQCASSITPWIQTTGDVHSNTGINAPGGP